MLCKRCKNDIPDILWMEGADGKPDHPILLDHPITINRTEFPDDRNQMKITMHAYVERRICSDVNPTPEPEKIFDWTTSTEVETAVFEALGAASTCWDTLEGAGVFHSERAKQIGDELVEYIKSKQPIY